MRSRWRVGGAGWWKRISVAWSSSIGLLPIQTDSILNAETIRALQVLADAYGLSAYDSAYLELAQRRGLGLATLDRRLAQAARGAGVNLIPL